MVIKSEMQQIEEMEIKDVSTVGELVSLLKRHKYWDNEDPINKLVRIANR